MSGPGQLGVELLSPTHPILLRPALPADGQALADLFSGPANSGLDPSAKPVEAQVMEERIAGWQPQYASAAPTRCNLIVAAADDARRVLGISGFGSIKTLQLDGRPLPADAEASVPTKRVGDAGVMLFPEVRGKGFGVEAMRVSIRFAFEDLRLDEVTVHTEISNAPMIAIMKRLGWEGTQITGEFGNQEFEYVKTREEWFQ